MIRFFSKLFLFLLALVLIKWLAVCIGSSINPINDTLTGKIRLLSTLKAPTNTIFIGSSRTYTSLNPAYFDSLTRQTHAVNFGVSSLFMPYTSDLCEEAITRPESGIRYILFELSLPVTRLDPFHGKPLKNANFYWHYELATLFPLTAKTYSVLNVHLNDQMYYLLSPSNRIFLGLKAKLLGLSRRQALGLSLPPSVSQHLSELMPSKPKRVNGYFSSTRQLAKKTAALTATHARGLKIYQNESLPMDPAYSFYYEKLNALQRLATQKGIKLFFYLPNRMNVEEAKVLPPFFRQLPPNQRLEIPYDTRFDQLFDPRFSKDEGHLNEYGARIYTGLMAEAFCKQVCQVP